MRQETTTKSRQGYAWTIMLRMTDHGPRNRKNMESPAAGMVTELLVASLLILFVFGNQFTDELIAGASSNVKPEEFATGHETITFDPARFTESIGRGSDARAT